MGLNTKYPHKSCSKWQFFKGKDWNNRKNYYDRLYKEMKRFGKAAITTLYNAQTSNTRQAWCEPGIQQQTEDSLHQLLKLHPDRLCRWLSDEPDMILLKHITYHTQKEFKVHYGGYMVLGGRIDEERIPRVYAEALEGVIRTLNLTDEHADSNEYTNGDGLNDAFDFNTFSSDSSMPNAHSPLFDTSSNIEDVDELEDLDLIHGQYISQDFGVSPLSPNNAAIEPNLKTTVNHYDTEFPMGASVSVGVPLPKTHTVDQGSNTMNNFVSPSSRNDTHWYAFVDTEASASVEDTDTILRNVRAANTQPTGQAPHTIPLHDTFWDWNHGFDADILALSENAKTPGDFSAAPLKAQPAISAVPMQYHLLSTNANTNGISDYLPVGPGISTYPNGSGNAASYLPLGTFFDGERNVAWKPNMWTALDRTTINPRLPDPNDPRAGYQDYNIDLNSANLNHPHNQYQASTFPIQSPSRSPLTHPPPLFPPPRSGRPYPNEVRREPETSITYPSPSRRSSLFVFIVFATKQADLEGDFMRRLKGRSIAT